MTGGVVTAPPVPRRAERLIMDAVMELLAARERGGPWPPLNLAMGVSAFDHTPYLEPDGSAAGGDLRGYGEPLGRLALREGISRYYGEHFGLDVPPARICVTDGASGALVLALGAASGPGREVMVPDVGFPVFAGLVGLLGATAVRVPLDARFTYALDALEDRVTARTAAIVVNSPSNPFGTALTRGQLERLADLGVPLVSDEVYLPLAGDGAATSVAQVADGHFVIGSFSKMFAAPGLRLGYVIVPERFLEAVKGVKALVNLTTSAPAQRLGERLLAGWRRVLEAHRAFLADCREGFREACQRRALCPLLTPEAGFFAVLDTSGWGQDSATLAERLVREYGLAVAPGADFAS
ncbi:MAG TPA: pyridoxal phosphate-dependent aminotransferase, partial [Methylomirabilota bacterium]|nr:pyridoxal phosphate-dependent aminotransferase [Methylomirabilota bacterium]